MINLLYKMFFNKQSTKKRDIEYDTKSYVIDYNTNNYICKFWNISSNLIFIVIGFLRLANNEMYYDYHELVVLYKLFICSGFCNAIHNALNHKKYTIFLNWMPIVGSIMYLLYKHHLLEFITLVSLLKVCLICVVFIIDHIFAPINSPFDNVFWYLLIGLAIDSAYTDIFIYY